MSDESKGEGGQRGGGERRGGVVLNKDGPPKTLQFNMASVRHGHYDGKGFLWFDFCT